MIEGDNTLLYYKNESTGEYMPAVYSMVETAFNTINAKPAAAQNDPENPVWFRKVGNGYEPVAIPEQYSIEMLIPEYTLQKPVRVNQNRNVVFTTASRNATDGFPYAGGSTAAEIQRGFTQTTLNDPVNFPVDSMFTVQKHSASNVDDGGQLTLGTITLDGDGEHYTSETNGGIVWVEPGGKLTVGTGATLQNAKIKSNLQGAAIYLEQYTRTGEGSTMYISGAPVFRNNVRSDAHNNDNNWKNGGDQTGDYYANGVPQDIYIRGYSNTKATALVVTGDITSDSGSIAVWADTDPHFIQNQQFAVMEGGTWTGLDAFRNARKDSDTKNPLVDENRVKYLYGIARNGDVYWSGGSNLVIQKTVTGPFADESQVFSFTVSGLNNDYCTNTSKGCEYTIEATSDGGTTWSTVTNVNDLGVSSATGKLTATTDADHKITFSLKHNQRITISIPRGLTVTVVEVPGLGQPSYGITTVSDSTGTTGTGSAVSNIVMNEDTTVTFTNHFPAVGPTGVSFRSLPFALMLLMGLALPALMPRRRRKEEE